MLGVHEKNQLLAKVIDATTQGVTITDADGTILYVNKAFMDITGYSENEVIGQNPRLLKSGIHKASFYRHLWTSLITKGYWQGEIWNKNKLGEPYPEWLNITAIRDRTGRVENYVAVFSDITELKKIEKELVEVNESLSKLTNLDGLTGIANRRAFNEKLRNEWKRSRRSKSPLSLILLDIDHFKRFNDTYGHQQGDKCLKKVALVLEATATRSGDLVARYGGEEFAVILPDTAETGGRIIAEELRKNTEALQIPNEKSDVSPFVTISVGVSTYYPVNKELTYERFVELTDTALYESKTQGRNRVKVSDLSIKGK
ncbi:diguanylate cyclase [Cytobacillus suaedae]|nr:diguanylate cyclase [Cytobacillus suaedae]